MLIFAIIALAGGLAIVLANNIWSGGILPLLVTLIGWIMLEVPRTPTGSKTDRGQTRALLLGKAGAARKDGERALGYKCRSHPRRAEVAAENGLVRKGKER